MVKGCFVVGRGTRELLHIVVISFPQTMPFVKCRVQKKIRRGNAVLFSVLIVFQFTTSLLFLQKSSHARLFFGNK